MSKDVSKLFVENVGKAKLKLKDITNGITLVGQKIPSCSCTFSLKLKI